MCAKHFTCTTVSLVSPMMRRPGPAGQEVSRHFFFCRSPDLFCHIFCCCRLAPRSPPPPLSHLETTLHKCNVKATQHIRLSAKLRSMMRGIFLRTHNVDLNPKPRGEGGGGGNRRCVREHQGRHKAAMISSDRWADKRHSCAGTWCAGNAQDWRLVHVSKYYT